MAASAFTTLVTGWLLTPADETADHKGGGQLSTAGADEARGMNRPDGDATSHYNAF